MLDEPRSGKRTAATICAVLLGIIFLVSGGWKVLNPFQTGELLEQAQVPSGFGVLGAASLGTIEVFTAFLLFAPRFRRWGGLLGSALMVFFICWIGYYYHVLVGHECSCFPLIKRSVGPGFFFTDAIFLLLGIVAFLWSPPVRRFRVPAVVFTALVVLAGISFSVNAAQRTHAQIPTPIMVDGKPQDLSHGKVFLFFYDPSCMHCDAAAKFMATLNWTDTQLVSIPTVNPQWAAEFLHDTHLKSATSLETDKLRKSFKFVDPPYGVALIDGQVKGTYGQAQFVPPQPAAQLRNLGLVQ